MKTRKKILLVDDERAIVKVIGIKLSISGYDVVSASDGQEALDLLTSAYPDIMLLDVIMPGVDGFEVLQKLRESSDLPVIVFSAHPENAQEAFNLGANDFLSKPLDVNELVEKIDTVLSGKS